MRFMRGIYRSIYPDHDDPRCALRFWHDHWSSVYRQKIPPKLPRQAKLGTNDSRLGVRRPFGTWNAGACERLGRTRVQNENSGPALNNVDGDIGRDEVAVSKHLRDVVDTLATESAMLADKFSVRILCVIGAKRDPSRWLIGE